MVVEYIILIAIYILYTVQGFVTISQTLSTLPVTAPRDMVRAISRSRVCIHVHSISILTFAGYIYTSTHLLLTETLQN